MMYDGTSDSIGMIPYLSAILGAREIEAWGRPPLIKNKLVAGAVDENHVV
jgi:hypothetical protein